jgi:hypothetical protein
LTGASEDETGPYAAALARQREKAQQATDRRADEKKTRDDRNKDKPE